MLKGFEEHPPLQCVCSWREVQLCKCETSWSCFFQHPSVFSFDEVCTKKLTGIATIYWFCRDCKLFRDYTAFSNVFYQTLNIPSPNPHGILNSSQLDLVFSCLILIRKGFQRKTWHNHLHWKNNDFAFPISCWVISKDSVRDLMETLFYNRVGLKSSALGEGVVLCRYRCSQYIKLFLQLSS